MTFSTVKKNLESIDYAWTKPQTYLVFVPGLSLLIQKIQLAKTLPLTHPVDITVNNANQANQKSRHFANICKWHLRGSTTQLIASLIAVEVFATPLFLAIYALAVFELSSITISAFKNPATIHEFYPGCGWKKEELSTVLNFF